MRNKTSNDNYYLLTMAAIAQEIRYRRGERKTDVVLAAGLPLASFGREKKGFREYLFRKEQPLRFRYEDESYEIRIQDVKLFPQGYSALALHPECVRDEPSVLLADIGGWTVDLMRLDNSVPNAATCRSLELGVIQNGEYIFKSHDYRHTVATNFYEHGVSIQSIRDYLGHTFEEMTMQYIDYMPRKIAKQNDTYFEKEGNSLLACMQKGEQNE